MLPRRRSSVKRGYACPADVRIPRAEGQGAPGTGCPSRSASPTSCCSP